MFTKTGIGGALKDHARQRTGLLTCERKMKKAREVSEKDEPIGIIISRGDRTEQRPVFSAYIWGPAPEPAVEPSTRVA
jgi:hypothetical protein